MGAGYNEEGCGKRFKFQMTHQLATDSNFASKMTDDAHLDLFHCFSLFSAPAGSEHLIIIIYYFVQFVSHKTYGGE